MTDTDERDPKLLHQLPDDNWTDDVEKAYLAWVEFGKKAAKALRYYADQDNWVERDDGTVECECDVGEVARAALADTGEPKPCPRCEGLASALQEATRILGNDIVFHETRVVAVKAAAESIRAALTDTPAPRPCEHIARLWLADELEWCRACGAIGSGDDWTLPTRAALTDTPAPKENNDE